MAREMKPRRRQIWAYVSAPILIGVAVLIRNALLGKTGGPEPDLLLLAVAIAGALGGFGPAAVATAVGLLEEIYFQTEPVRTFLVPRHRDQVELAIFVASGVACQGSPQLIAPGSAKVIAILGSSAWASLSASA